MTSVRRAEAAARVRALHPPLVTLFAALRAEQGGEPVKSTDELAERLVAVAAESAGDDPDDLALRLALAVEDLVLAAARAGARDARDAGVPGDGDVGDSALDPVIAALQPYAAEVVASGRTGPPPRELAGRIRALARSAGVIAAVSDVVEWTAVQRFGDPWCPRADCYGRDGAPLTPEWLATEGVPPYGDGCNCRAEAAGTFGP